MTSPSHERNSSAGTSSRPPHHPFERLAARIRRDRATYVTSTVSVVSLFAAWTVITMSGLVSDVPSPQELASTFVISLTDGYSGTPLLGHVWASVRRALSGLTLGVALGVPTGLVVGYFPNVNAALKPVLSFIRPIPALAFIPLIILYLGIGEVSKVFVVFVPAFLYMVLNTSAGVRSVPGNYLRAALNLGIPRITFFRLVILPYAMPFILTGLRTAVALSWAVMVAAELIAAQSGLGFMIMDASVFYRLPDLYLGLVLIGLIGIAFELLLDVLEKRTLHWVQA